MTFMPWSPALSVGRADIDEQHHWLLDTMNQLHDQLTAAVPDRLLVAHALEGLMDYTMNHFVVEEMLFEQYNYPHAAAHRQLHDQFTYKLMALITDFENGNDLGSDALEMFRDWLVNHIMVVDKAYVPYLSEACCA